MLGGARVLIVEDETFTALDLAAEIDAAGGRVVGPFPSVAAALRCLETAEVAGAILDANLVDRDVTPVAVVLSERGVPVIIHTGIGLPAELRRLWPDIPVFSKPTPSKEVVEALARMIWPVPARAGPATSH